MEKNGMAAWSDVKKEHSGEKDLPLCFRRSVLFFFFLIQSFALDSNKREWGGKEKDHFLATTDEPCRAAE